MNWKLIWHRVFWWGLAVFFGINALWQCYDMGYKSAEWKAQDREFVQMQRHSDEVIAAMKKVRPADEYRAYLNVELGEDREEAGEKLKFLHYHMMDYLTPNDDGSYDSHWLYKPDVDSADGPTQAWVTLTIGKDKKVLKKNLEVRKTPK